MVRATVRSSLLLAAIAVILHASVAATLMPLDVAMEVKLGAVTIIATSLIHTLCRHALLRTPGAVVEIEVRDRATAAVRTRAGDWRDVEILGTSYVTASLTVLNVRARGRRHRAQHVLLLRDNMDAEDFRRIRVLLRWARPTIQTTA